MPFERPGRSGKGLEFKFDLHWGSAICASCINDKMSLRIRLGLGRLTSFRIFKLSRKALSNVETFILNEFSVFIAVVPFAFVDGMR